MFSSFCLLIIRFEPKSLNKKFRIYKINISTVYRSTQRHLIHSQPTTHATLAHYWSRPSSAYHIGLPLCLSLLPVGAGHGHDLRLLAGPQRQVPRVGHHVPVQVQGHVGVVDEAAAVVLEVVLGVLVLESDLLDVVVLGDDLVPQHDLVDAVLGSGVLCQQVHKHLLHVPVEQRFKVCLKVKLRHSKVKRAGGAAVFGEISQLHLLDGDGILGGVGVVVEGRGAVAAEGEEGEGADGEGQQSVGSVQAGVHR